MTEGVRSGRRELYGSYARHRDLETFPVATWMIISVAVAIVSAVANALIAINIQRLGPSASFPILVISLIFIGLLSGGQWLVLRRFIDRAWQWPLATVAGWLVTLAFSGYVLSLVDRSIQPLGGGQSPFPVSAGRALYFNVVSNLALALVVGLVVGGAQWLVLRRYATRARWWAPAILVAGLFAVFVNGAIDGVLYTVLVYFDANSILDASPESATVYRIAFAILTGAVSGAISGGVGGLVLAWILREYRRDVQGLR